MKIIFKNEDNSIGIITPTMKSIYLCNDLPMSINKKNALSDFSEDELKEIISSFMDIEEAYKIAMPITAEKDVPSPYKIPLEWGKDENDEDMVTKWGEYHTPYWIVEDSTIPEDRTFRSAWTVNESIEPDGFGGESNEFDAELLAKYKGELV